MTLQLNEICDENNDNDIRKVLRSLPLGLNETYARILKKIFSQRKPDIAKKILTWVAGARRPLSLDELTEAISLEPTDTLWAQCRCRLPNSKLRMIQNCGSLLTVAHTETGDIVQFAHYTVVEFLQSTAASSDFQILLRKVNIHIARICLMYLSLPDFETQIAAVPKKSALETSPARWIPWMVQSNPATRVIWNAATEVIWGRSKVPAVDVQALLQSTMKLHSQRDTLKRQYRLLKYVATYWLDHCSEVSPDSQDDGGRTWKLFTELTLRKSHLGDIPWLGENPDGPHYATQFHWCMKNGHSALLRLIMDEVGTGFTTYDNLFGPSPEAFRRSCSLGHGTLVGLYLDRYRKLCDRDGSIHHAVAKGHVGVVEQLLKAGADVHAADYNGLTTLHYAAREGHLNIVEQLLEAGADVHAEDNSRWTALHCAAGTGHPNIVGRLLEAGADVHAEDHNGLTTLHHAASGGHPNVVEKLLEAGANVYAANICQWTALHYAAHECHPDVAERLLKAGADVHAVDEDRLTALHYAAREGHPDVAGRLLKAGADVHAEDSSQLTALHYAARGDHLDIVERLLEAGADVHAVDRVQSTVLHYAAREGHLDIVGRLLEASADVHEVDIYRSTALHYAARGGYLNVAERLLKAGADINVENGHGETPYKAAIQKGHTDVSKLLLKPGCNKKTSRWSTLSVKAVRNDES